MRDRSGIMNSMNRLSTEQRKQIVACLVEGNSIRATCRMTGAAKGTVLKLLSDLKKRLRHRVQLTTDGLRTYLYAVEDAFDGDVDYAQLVKLYGHDSAGARKSGAAK